MCKKFAFIALSLCLLFVFSCVSKSKYVELENQMNATRTQLEQENERLSAQLAQLQRELEQERTTAQNLESKIQNQKKEIQDQKKEISQLDQTRKEIESSLQEQIARKDIRIEEIEGKLKVTFVDRILFDSGSVKIKPEGREALLRLADSFKNKGDQQIVVEGHTDDVKIGAALLNRFPTNWELSAARATAVVRFFQEKGEIDPQRLTASGFSFYRPVASNELAEGRELNRRIEILLLPER